MIDLLAIQPHKISTDLSSYCTMLYGVPKVGKTSFMHELFGDEMLLVATEKGYLARAGIMAVDVPRWKEFTDVIRQLKKPEIKAKFKVVVIDTIDLLYEMAQKHVLMTNGWEKLNDAPFGQAYQMVDNLFKDAILEIQGLGYGVAFISHSTASTNEETGQIKYAPSLNKRGAGIINKMVDVIGFAYLKKSEEGEEVRTLYLRETLAFTAGCRFGHMSPAIPLQADLFKEEMKNAIEKIGEDNEDALTSTKATRLQLVEELSFEQLLEDLRSMGIKFRDADAMEKYYDVVENHLGKARKVSELVQGQEEIMSIIYDELVEIAQGLKI